MTDLFLAATTAFTGLTVSVTALYVIALGLVGIGVAFIWIRKGMRGRG